MARRSNAQRRAEKQALQEQSEAGSRSLRRLSIGVPLVVLLAFLLHSIDPRISLTGRVVDTLGKPIHGARVEWQTELPFGITRSQGESFTDRDGEFQIYRRRLRGPDLRITAVCATGYQESPSGEVRLFHFSEGKDRFDPEKSGMPEFTLQKTARFKR